jgi:hypothetical protein
MPIEIPFLPKQQARRWLGYFDLLGTRTKIESGGYLQVFDVYAKALEKSKQWKANSPSIQHVCFSDTFLIYSSTDSAQDFALIDQVARWFIYELIVAKIPVRGAISCGDFYSDCEQNLYFGKALIEAYEYGEAQDWLGFLLTPSAVLQLDKVGLPANERLSYAYWHIPFKDGRGHGLTNELPACILGGWVTINGENLCAKAIAEMKERITDQGHLKKYSNTLEFIQNNHRTPTTNDGNT